jgi:hypothetical protein
VSEVKLRFMSMYMQCVSHRGIHQGQLLRQHSAPVSLQVP